MADAPQDWKVNCLQTIRDNHHIVFESGRTPKQELIWVHDLERDGYITAKFRMGYLEDGDTFVDSTIPNLIWDVHVIAAGRQLILDFETPPKKPQTDWGKVVGWITFATFASGILIYLCSHFLK